MWFLIFVVVALVFAGVVTVLGGGIFTLILVPLFLVAAVAATVAVWLRAQARDDERTVAASQPEPAGRPRTGSPEAGTANERVGQV